jgi:hypothetical protein
MNHHMTMTGGIQCIEYANKMEYKEHQLHSHYVTNR